MLTQRAKCPAAASRRWLRHEWATLLGAFLLAALCLGCNRRAPESPSPDAEAQAESGAEADDTVELRVAVFADPALAESIRREVNARRSTPIQVSSLSWSEWAQSLQAPEGNPSPLADVLVFPTWGLGDLVAAQALREVPARWQQDPVLNMDDFLPVTRQHEIRWGEANMALPLGSTCWMLYYRADLLERLQLSVPTTWADYDERVRKLTERPAELPADQTWIPAAEPLAAGWAGRMFLARAAGYVQNRSQYSTLFDSRTFEPLITGPAFRRALTELVQSAGPYATVLTDADPARCEELVLSGQAGLAISFPSAHRARSAAAPPAANNTAANNTAAANTTASAGGTAAADSTSVIRIAPLPGTLEAWEGRTNSWRRRTADESPWVPLVGIEGRLVGVSRRSPHPIPAWNLAATLTQAELLLATSPHSPVTLPPRLTLLEKTRSWLTPELPSQVVPDVVRVIKETHEATSRMMIPPVPGLDRYLAALDLGVQRAVRGEVTPEAALQEVATAWQALTAELGPERQASAYQAYLGIEL